MPKFSVLIPTRNRPRHVGNAIRSALSQTTRDLEIVVSDNSSNDETAAVVAEFRDPRIRYLRTPRTLGMPDNFDNVISHSSGDWVTLIPDDCVVSSRLLENVERALELRPSQLVVWDFWSYYPPETRDPRRRHQYIKRPFDSSVRYQDAKAILADLYRFRHGNSLPKPYQSCVHRSLVDTLRAKLGRVFPPPAPDYTFLTALLVIVDRYTFINLPMMFSSSTETTPHASEASFNAFLTELDADKKGGWTPIKLPFIRPFNIIAESMCRMRELLPELAGHQIDLDEYLANFRFQLAECADLQFPVEFEMNKYKEFMATLPRAQRLRIEWSFAKQRARQLAWLRAKELLLRAPLLVDLAGRASGKVVVRGQEHGFSTILEAMKHLEGSYQPLRSA